MVWRHWLVTVGALAVVNGSLAAFALSRTDRGIFGFTETGFNPSPEAALALVVEIAAAALLVVVLAWELPPPEGRAMRLDRTDGRAKRANE